MSVLVAYASKHGATAEIAEFIGRELRNRELNAEVASVETDPDPGPHAAFVIGSGVYGGLWLKPAERWVRAHQEELAGKEVWLFSSGPLGDLDVGEDQPGQLEYLTEALHPRDHQMFAGALDSSKLGFAERMMIKAVKAPEGDFRDWEAIGSWAAAIADVLVEAHPAGD